MPALVDSAADPEQPGLTNYTITAMHPGDVQTAIFNIMDSVVNAEVTFDNPRRSYSIQDGLTAWRARGYVRSFNAVSEACADVRAWQRERAAR